MRVPTVRPSALHAECKALSDSDVGVETAGAGRRRSRDAPVLVLIATDLGGRAWCRLTAEPNIYAHRHAQKAFYT